MLAVSPWEFKSRCCCLLHHIKSWSLASHAVTLTRTACGGYKRVRQSVLKWHSIRKMVIQMALPYEIHVGLAKLVCFPASSSTHKRTTNTGSKFVKLSFCMIAVHSTNWQSKRARHRLSNAKLSCLNNPIVSLCLLAPNKSNESTVWVLF